MKDAQTQNAPVCERQSGAEGRNVQKKSSTQASQFAFVPEHDLRWEAGLFCSFEQLHSQAISRSPVQNAERPVRTVGLHCLTVRRVPRRGYRRTFSSSGGTACFQEASSAANRSVENDPPDDRDVSSATCSRRNSLHVDDLARQLSLIARFPAKLSGWRDARVTWGARVANTALRHERCGTVRRIARLVSARGSRPSCRPSTANGSSFRVCSARRRTSRSCGSDLDTPSSTTYTDTFRRTSLVYGSGHLPLAHTASVVDESRLAMQAGFMQPRDSVASRNSARRHWPYYT